MRLAAIFATIACLVGLPALSAAAQEVPAAPAAPPPADDAPAQPEVSAEASAADQAPLPQAAHQPPAPAPSGGEPRPPVYQPLGGVPEKQAEEGDWDPWDHPEAFGRNDHTGFFLRLALGFGYGNATASSDGDGGDGPGFAGGGLGFDVAIGGSVARNFAIHGELFGMAMPSPGVTDGSPAIEGTDVQLGALGIGATYHFMPVNLYVSGAAGLGTVAFERNDSPRSSSRLGFAANFMLGKEWWVDSQWGLGLAGQLIYVTAADRQYDHINGLALNVLFSATYN